LDGQAAVDRIYEVNELPNCNSTSFFSIFMSIPHLSTEQRVQQLESTVINLVTQVSELTRELQAARSQQEQLQRACDSYQFAEHYIDEAIVEQIPRLQQRVDRIEDELEIYEEDEEQPVDSD
jgi:predicted RNase H-like nuclease (RuvC/YqgF family)